MGELKTLMHQMLLKMQGSTPNLVLVPAQSNVAASMDRMLSQTRKNDNAVVLESKLPN